MLIDCRQSVPVGVAQRIGSLVCHVDVDVVCPVVIMNLVRPAFDELYRSQYVGMVRVAWLVVGSESTAEDLVQDAFLRLANRYDTIRNPPAYLRVTVINGCRNELRRTRKIDPHSPPDKLVGQPDLVLLYQGLRTLDARHRAAIVLRYIDDRSDSEIAMILGVRQATVRSMVHRGLTKA